MKPDAALARRDGDATTTRIRPAASGHLPRAGLLPLVLAGLAALVYFFAVDTLYTRVPPDSTAVVSGVLSAGQRSDDAGRPVDLPSHWQRDCSDCLQAWYAFDLPTPRSLPHAASAENVALYLPMAKPRFAAYLNGDLLHVANSDERGLSSRASGPRIIRVPPATLTSDNNRLLIFINADYPGRATLGPLYVGAASTLMPYYHLRNVLAPGVAYFSSVFCIIVGMLMLALWAQRRERREYAWFATLAVLWAIVNWPDAVFGGDWGHWLQAAALALLAAAAVRFAGLFAPARYRVGMRLVVIAALAALMLAVVLLVAHDTYFELTEYWTASWLLVLAGGQAALAWRVCHRGSFAAWSAVPAVVVTVLALRDAWWAIGLSTSTDTATLAFAAPVYVGAFAWLLLTGFIDTLRSTQELNVWLDEMVRAKTIEIENQYQHMQALESERILALERERIMRDMHDGVGGQLVSAMALIDSNAPSSTHNAQLREALSGALTDMRLMIDSLESIDEDLNAVLAMFRDRMQQHLTAAGIELEWRVADLPPVAGLGPSNALNVLRIMQETVTNTLKHATANRIVVRAEPVAGTGMVEIEISDDGRGFEVTAASALGHGLDNMRMRARENDIDLDIHSAPGQGTSVCLRFHSTSDPGESQEASS